MSSTSSSWFRKGIGPGTIITLDQPPSSQWETTQWKVLEKLNEHDFQVTRERNKDHGTPSYATAKLLCCDPTYPSRKAIMRIYLQVPYRMTEIDDADTRSRQAMSFTPSELTAYQSLTLKGSPFTPRLLGWKQGTQDRSGIVPGGFVIWLVYEKVPGLQLGNKYGADLFWALEQHEKDELIEIGWYPNVPAARSLAWDKEEERLYFVGRFVKAGKLKNPGPLGPEWLAKYQLAKPQPKGR